MPDTPSPPEFPEDIDDLFAAFAAGDIDGEPVSSEERRRMVAASRVVRHATPLEEPPPALRGQVLERIRLEAQSVPTPAPTDELARARRRRARTRRWVSGLAAAAAASVIAVVVLGGGHGATAPPLLFDAALGAVPGGPSPAAEGGSDLSRQGDGYLVHLEMEGLAPTKGFSSYELWYVGPGDSRAHPNRVAIGSFRTRDGKVNARWPAAFDGSRFTRVSVTLEPHDDGDPAVNGPEVATGQSVRQPEKPTK